jgi:hypothetical protein
MAPTKKNSPTAGNENDPSSQNVKAVRVPSSGIKRKPGSNTTRDDEAKPDGSGHILLGCG